MNPLIAESGVWADMIIFCIKHCLCGCYRSVFQLPISEFMSSLKLENPMVFVEHLCSISAIFHFQGLARFKSFVLLPL